MIGIVIVSHSAKIAEGVVELCYEMVDKDMKILPAGKSWRHSLMMYVQEKLPYLH